MSTHLLLAPSQWGAAQRTYLAPFLRLPPLHLADTGWKGERRAHQRQKTGLIPTISRPSNTMTQVSTVYNPWLNSVTSSTQLLLELGATLCGPFVMSQWGTGGSPRSAERPREPVVGFSPLSKHAEGLSRRLQTGG